MNSGKLKKVDGRWFYGRPIESGYYWVYSDHSKGIVFIEIDNDGVAMRGKTIAEESWWLGPLHVADPKLFSEEMFADEIKSKLCKNCMWFKDKFIGIEENKFIYSFFCRHPEVIEINFIIGKTRRPSCNDTRADLGKCGPEGILWEGVER
jgi:hypothetical protein